jgi:hypothetical protein
MFSDSDEVLRFIAVFNPWVLGSIPRRPTTSIRRWPATSATVLDFGLVWVILCGADVGP